MPRQRKTPVFVDVPPPVPDDPDLETPAAPEQQPDVTPRPVSPDPSPPEPSAPSRPPARPVPATEMIDSQHWDLSNPPQKASSAWPPPVVPPAELTPDQRRIKELEDMLAKERGKKDIEPEFTELPAAAVSTGTIRIHFLEDGLTALGRIWYRGEELEVVPGSPEYADTCDRNGRSWLELRDNEFAQVERWGHIKFRSGPWPGRTLADAGRIAFEPLRAVSGDAKVAPPTEEELAKAERLRSRRGAPRIPAL